jgi:hypothetical protein
MGEARVCRVCVQYPDATPSVPSTYPVLRDLTACLGYLVSGQYKVWVKPSSEMSFLYGNNVVKSGLGRMTEAIPRYAGVVVFSMNDVPLGESSQSSRAKRPIIPRRGLVLGRVGRCRITAGHRDNDSDQSLSHRRKRFLPCRTEHCSVWQSAPDSRAGYVFVWSCAGFGIAAQPTEYCKDLEPSGNVVLHQGDIGEYLRTESELS